MGLVAVPEASAAVVNAFKEGEPGSLERPLLESLLAAQNGSCLIFFLRAKLN